MKIFKMISAFLLTAATVKAHAFECEKSALKYIVSIANAPYDAASRITQQNLQVVSKKSTGDGAEAYEVFLIRRLDSSQSYRVKLYVEGTVICPLEKFEVIY